MGSVLGLDIESGRESHFLQRLQGCITGPVRQRVKGVVADSVDGSDELVHRLMHAERLTEIFDRADVEWVRSVLFLDRIFSVYHPIVRAADASVFAYEALVRARMPHGDEIAGAGQLLYASRKLNLQHKLDRAARISAIRGAANQNSLGDAKLFVNFMPNTIYDPEICLQDTVDEAERSGIGMDRIVFEVVETEQVESLDRLRQIVEFLRRHGAGVALDDLSSGYASLQFLADLMPDYVKIDRDLVTMAAASSSARHTLDSIVNLARKLDVKVIAEGVETEGQLDVCLQAGVDFLQGFLFALPSCPPQSVYVPNSMRLAA
jgi:EAL domain-containing protein (putative c-di-GMP-specific phosphodiesterase class I)